VLGVMNCLAWRLTFDCAVWLCAAAAAVVGSGGDW
jgi:hypothetical protein